MKTLSLGLGLALLCAGAQAQHATGSVLVQACQALKRQDDRNKCLEEAVKALAAQQQAPAPAPERAPAQAMRERAAGVLDAWSALESVSRLGISYRDYLPYLQRYAIEVDRYRALATGAERRAGIEFASALDLATAARDAWRNGIERRQSYEDQVQGLWGKAGRRADTARAWIDSGGDAEKFRLLAPVEPPPSIYETAAPLPPDADDVLRGKYACRKMVLDGLARPESATIGDYAGFAAVDDGKGGLRVSAPLQWRGEDEAPKSGAFDCRIQKNRAGEWSLAGLAIQ